MIRTKWSKECNVLTNGVSFKNAFGEKKAKLVSILSVSLVMHAHSFRACHNRKQKRQLSKCYEWTCLFVRQINKLFMFEHFVFEVATFE